MSRRPWYEELNNYLRLSGLFLCHKLLGIRKTPLLTFEEEQALEDREYHERMISYGETAKALTQPHWESEFMQAPQERAEKSRNEEKKFDRREDRLYRGRGNGLSDAEQVYESADRDRAAVDNAPGPRL